ncbi:MAG: InlB B-repeat-containing protein [Oscillibacter sp.]|nr:InlB B-repeat-containing protein [Oscillibacter sp.]
MVEGTVANGQTVGRTNLRFALTQSPWNGFRAMPNSTWYYSNEISRAEFVGADGAGTAVTYTATVCDFDTTVKVWDDTENFGSAFKSTPYETGGGITADAVTLPAADLPESLSLRVVRVGPYRWADSGSSEYEAYNYEEAGYFQFSLYNVTQGRDVPAGDYTVEYDATRQEVRFDTAAIAGEAQPSIQMGDTLRLSMTVDADKRESLHADLSGTYADEVTVKRNWTRADYENNAYRFDLRYNGWGNLRFSTTTGRSASTYETYGVYDSEGYLTASGSKGYWHEPEMEAAAGSYTLCVWRSTGWLGNAPAALSELEELLDSGEYQRETVTIRDGSYTVAELGASPALADHTLFTGDSGFLQDMYIASNGKMAQLRLAYEVSEEIAGANPGATYAIKVNLGGRTPPFELRTDYTWDNLEGYDRNINLYCDGVLNRESRVRLSFYSYNGRSQTPNGFTLYTDRPSGVIYFNLVGGGTTGKYSISAEGWLQESGSERKLQTGSIGSTTLSVETASNCDLYFTSDFLRMPDNGPDAGRSDYENGLWVYTVPWETVNLYLDDVLIASQRSGDGVAFFSFKMDESLKTKFSSGWSRTGTHTLFAETVLGDGTTVRSMTYQRECLSRTDSVRPAVLTGLEMQSTGVHGTIRPSSLLYYKGTTLVSRGERNQVYSYYTFQAGNSSYTFTATVENADWVDGDLLLNLTTGALDGYTVPLRRVAGTNTFSGTIDSTVPFSMWEVSFSSVRPAESGQVYAGEKPLSEATLLDVAGSGDTVLDYNGNPVTVQALYDSVYNHFMDEYGDREDELRSMIQEDAAMELDALGEFFQSVAGITGTPLPEGLAFDGSDACLDYLRQYLGINVIYPLSENAQLSAYRSWDSDCAVTTTLDGSVKREYTRIVVETSETDGKPHLYEMLITIVENPAGSDLADYGIVKVTDCGVSSLDAARFANTDLLAWLGALDLSDLTGGTLAELLGADDQRGKSGINAQSLTNIAVFDSGSTNTINQINAGLKKVTETINGGAAHSDSLYWNLTKQSKDQLYVDRDTGTAEGAALTELETRINNLKEAGEQSGKLTQEQISTLNELLQVVKDVYEVHVEHVARELAEAGYDGAKSIREVMDALKSVKDMSKHMAGEAVDDAWNRAYESDSNWYKYNPLYWALRPVAWVTNVLDEYDAFNQLVTDNAKRLAMDPERYLIKDPAAKKHRENMEDALINLGYVLNELNYEYDLGVKNPSWNVRLNTNAGRNTPIIDPQGIVYEAVLSNPVEGATATLYERTGDGAETAWDATDYGQINPQTTDSTGQYQWFVPEGEWQVRVSAPAGSGLSDNTSAGHDAANLDDGSTVGWLPVMPVQLGINIPLTSTESPVVQSANVYAGYAEVVFSRYMDVSTLTADAIAIQTGGAAVPCTLSFPDQDADPLDSSKLYAKTVRLTPVSGGFESGASYTVTVADSVSGYNGRTLPEAYQSGTLTTGQASAPVLTPDKSSLNLTTGGMETVTITLKSADNTPMAGVTVNGTSDKTSIATVTASAVTDSEGKAAFTVTGGRSGGAAVTFATADGLVEASVNVTVSEAGGNGGGTGENPGENPSSETKYTVTFNSNGGSAVAAQSVVSGGKAVRPANPTKSGYNFDNWYVSSDFATVFDFNSPVNNNMTLYANWTAVQQTQKRGCYVATAVYGSYDCPEVWTLRRFRDQVLARTWYGRLFIKLYYAVSPTAVRLFGNFAWFQDFFRSRLDGMVSELQSDGFASTPYDDPAW